MLIFVLRKVTLPNRLNQKLTWSLPLSYICAMGRGGNLGSNLFFL
jgi:hypothetical protein